MVKNVIIALLMVTLSAVLYLQWYKEGFVFSGVGDYRQFDQENYWLVAHKDKPGFAFFSSKSKLVAQLSDSDGDGVVDLLIYSTLDEEGKQRIEYEDYGMDGEMDLRTIYPEGRTGNSSYELAYLGTWYKLEGKGPNLHIKVGNQSIPVVNEEGFLSVKTHNKALK
ncbi:hypothetical protein [Neptuniibacter sp. QD34_54]|uniref:hypothetical protein n=1 Tax=Neptuniibacter sp. QD34_54 TaxID=3398208 RepID=UPI0039F594A9